MNVGSIPARQTKPMIASVGIIMISEQTKTDMTFTASVANSVAKLACASIFVSKMSLILDKIESAAKDGRFTTSFIIADTEKNVETEILEELEFREFKWSLFNTSEYRVTTNYVVCAKKYIVSWY